LTGGRSSSERPLTSAQRLQINDAKLAAYNAAVALGVQDEGVRLGGPGQYQVAKVSLKDLDLKAIDPSVFADAEETGTPSR